MLTGQVARIDLDSLVLDVRGVGYLIHTTPQSLAATRHGAELTLHTELVVREESLTLYGFSTAEEADTFRIVQSVSGVGPRTALALLAVLEPQRLYRAVAEQDAKTLTTVPGIGPKGAGRMLLELGGKLPAPAPGEGGQADVPAGADGPETAGAAAGGAVAGQVIEALVGLGWPEKSAAAAVDRVLAELEREAAPEAAAPEAALVLRRALRDLGGSR
jgi:Holliday junction DNA helicase RuvA